MKKLDSVKKPRSIISSLTTLLVIFSLAVFVTITVLLVVAYNSTGKTNVSEDLVIPILRSFIYIFPVEGVLVFILISLLTVYRLVNKKGSIVRSVNSFYDFARSDVMVIDECDVFVDNKCVVKEVVKLSKENENEIIDIVGSIASMIHNGDPVVEAIQKLSFIPLFSNVNVEDNNGAYLASHKDKKYVLGEFGTFKYRAEEYVKTKVEPYILKGFGITLIGRYEKDIKTDKYAEFADVFGVIVTKNEVNPKYRKMIESLQNEGIEFKLISSDNPIAASEYAKSLGVKNGEKFYLMQNKTSVDNLLVNDHVVFGYADPEQKVQIIKELQKERHVVTSLVNGSEKSNANCSLSYISNSSDVTIDDPNVSVDELYQESISFKNKIDRLFVLLMFKIAFVDLFMIGVSICSLFGFNFDYKPLGLGVLLTTIALASLFFIDDYEKGFKVKSRLLLGTILSLGELLAMFILFAVQYNGLAYTGINGLDVALTMCGIIYIASQFVIFASLLQPLSKKRSIVLLVNTLIVAIPTIILWIISKNINNGLFGLAFNKLNGQCLITMLLTFIVFTSLYFVITYLIDNYKKGGDK